MTTIELRFPARRFHATSWGRHVNEGVAEWPPSPYRLLRALYDVWKRKHADLAEDEIAELLRELAMELPRYALPPAAASHTRSYLNSNELDPTAKSLIFDAFVTLAPGAACQIVWPGLELAPRQRELLRKLLGSLNYLGRSESWVEAALSDSPSDSNFVCEPLIESRNSGDAIPIACAVSPREYTAANRSWFAALTYSTSNLVKERRSAPPGMKMVQYVRTSGAVATYIPKPRLAHAGGVEAVLLSFHATVLPLVTSTIEVAEQIRTRLMGIHKGIMGDAAKVSAKFCGKDANGEPRKDHGHAFILPLANGRGRIDRALIFTRAEEGFDGLEIRAILGLRELWGSRPKEPVKVAATWRGDFQEAPVWHKGYRFQSRTPFCPGRHWRKGRGSFDEFLIDEVRRECKNHGMQQPVRVEPMRETNLLFEWVEFRRNRRDEDPRPGYGFQIEFAEPAAGPFSLGYGCHFGLGQFGAD